MIKRYAVMEKPEVNGDEVSFVAGKMYEVVDWQGPNDIGQYLLNLYDEHADIVRSMIYPVDGACGRVTINYRSV
jgi:hypothetical protein